MKYLSDYTNDAFNAVFEKYGVFFAFSNEQLEEKAVPGVEYVRGSAGMIMPKQHIKAIDEALDKAVEVAIAQDVAENGKEKIILRELSNYECFYTGDISDCIGAVSQYGYTAEDVLKVYSANYEEAIKHF